MSETVVRHRRVLLLVGVGVLIAVAYDGWIFYSRWWCLEERLSGLSISMSASQAGETKLTKARSRLSAR